MTPLGVNELYLAVALAAGFAINWAVLFFSLRGKDEALKALIENGHLLRLSSVIVVVATVGYLTVIGKLTAEATAIFSGIAGYVLGGVTASKHSG